MYPHGTVIEQIFIDNPYHYDIRNGSRLIKYACENDHMHIIERYTTNGWKEDWTHVTHVLDTKNWVVLNHGIKEEKYRCIDGILRK